MIKELIFSSKKYYEGKEPCYVGKTFKSPTSPVDKWKTNTDSFYYLEPAHESVIPSGPILGQVEDQANEIFLMGGILKQYYLVKLTDLIQNGGGIE